MKQQFVVFATGLSMAWGVAAVLAQTPAPPAAPAGKVDIVAVTGCVKEQGTGNWMLVNATDPVPSIANAPPVNERPATAPAGKNQFKLIGVSEFNLPSYKDRPAIVKGLLIKGTPVSRVNITSVTGLSSSCAGGATK